jgi:predicted RNA-binding protein with RPS1 domain
VIARFVKHVRGRGVTVQFGDQEFGFIEMCEITDQITGNVFKHLQEKSIFAARVIDTDKNGKAQLSSRESVVNEDSW